MNEILAIVLAAAASTFILLVLFAVAVWAARKRGLLFLPKETHNLERRLCKLEAGLAQLERTSKRETDAGKRAEQAMTNILRGLARTTIQQEERLSALDKKKDS